MSNTNAAAKVGARTQLKDMGTTGLVDYAVNGGTRALMGARTGQAKKIIALRHKSWSAVVAFQRACNAAYEQKEAATLLKRCCDGAPAFSKPVMRLLQAAITQAEAKGA